MRPPAPRLTRSPTLPAAAHRRPSPCSGSQKTRDVSDHDPWENNARAPGKQIGGPTQRHLICIDVQPTRWRFTTRAADQTSPHPVAHTLPGVPPISTAINPSAARHPQPHRTMLHRNMIHSGSGQLTDRQYTPRTQPYLQQRSARPPGPPERSPVRCGPRRPDRTGPPDYRGRDRARSCVRPRRRASRRASTCCPGPASSPMALCRPETAISTASAGPVSSGPLP